MAYDINSQYISGFISDTNIKLPRFQRKQTWDAKKNFQLCISIFKQFPIGVCIFNVDDISRKGRTTRWLLDGRQRKNALTLLSEDPENVYLWAQKFIGFTKNDQPLELKEKFWEKINEFLEVDEDEEEEVKSNNPEIKDDDEDDEDDIEDVNAETDDKDDNPSASESPVDINTDAYGLNLLLDLILLTHNKNRKVSGFTRPFDFSKVVRRLPYISEDGVLSSKVLKQQFLFQYETYCKNNDLEEIEEENFVKFIITNWEVVKEEKLKSLVKSNWQDIVARIEVLQKVDELLRNSKIGYIEGKNLTLSESKKIFTLLNTMGDPLKYVEILSAKAKWNKKVQGIEESTKELVKHFYQEQLKTSVDDVVKWDLPAVFIKKLDDDLVFRKFVYDKKKPSAYDKALTFGFRCLAGIYQGGVGNDYVEQFSNQTLSDYEETVRNVKRMLETIKKFSYFKYFMTWGMNLMDLTADYVAMNFLVLAYYDYKHLDFPINGAPAKIFQKNCFKLWDKMLYEYLTGKWRSSADGKIHNNIEEYNYTKTINAVPQENWIELLEEIFNSNTLNGKELENQKTCRPILYHTYCLLQIAAHNGYSFDIDHIIPQTKFRASEIPNKDTVMHNILNLGIIPKDDNIKKSNNVLSQIVEQWAKDLISQYEFIDESDFIKFSQVSNYQEMYDARKGKFIEAFTTKRNELLNE